MEDLVFEIPKFSHVVFTLLFIYLSDRINRVFANKKRLQLAQQESKIYHQKLRLDYYKMEEKELDSKLEVAKEIEALKERNQNLEQEIGEDLQQDSDERTWSSDASLEELTNRFGQEEEDEEYGKDEIKKLEQKELERNTVLDQVQTLAQEVNSEESSSVGHDDCALVQALDETLDLKERIKLLELENYTLKEIKAKHENLDICQDTSNLDPELVKFLSKHSDITLDFLVKAYETLLELKASDPDLDLKEFIVKLKEDRDKLVAELTRLHIAKKESDIKYENMKKTYHQELTTFMDSKIEHMLKNSGSKFYSEGLHKKNQKLEEIIACLKTDLDRKRKEAENWQEKFKQVDQERITYQEALKGMELKKEQAEAQKRAYRSHQRSLAGGPSGPHLDLFSGGSSMMDDEVPGPPPIGDEEFFATLSEELSIQTSANMTNHNSSNIPPPAMRGMPSFTNFK